MSANIPQSAWNTLGSSLSKTINMPFPIVPLAIGALSAGANALTTHLTNKSQKKYAEETYAKQRADALADWKRENEYNSPAQQMQRLKEAGLNPNLVYGSGATVMGGKVGNVNAQSYNPQVPQVDLGAIPQTLSQFQNYNLQQQQTDNLKQAYNVAVAQEQKIKADTLSTLENTDYTTFKLFRDQTMMDYQVDAAKEQILNLRARTSLTLGQNEINWIMQPYRVQEIAQRVIESKARTANSLAQKHVINEQRKALEIANKYAPLTNEQKLSLGRIMKESGLLNNALTEKQVTSETLKQSLITAQEEATRAGINQKDLEIWLKALGLGVNALGIFTPKVHTFKQ